MSSINDARKGRGASNGSGKKWDDSPFWNNIPPVKTNECPHNRIVWGAVKKCKDYGEIL